MSTGGATGVGELRHLCAIGDGALYIIGVWDTEERVRARWTSPDSERVLTSVGFPSPKTAELTIPQLHAIEPRSPQGEPRILRRPAHTCISFKLGTQRQCGEGAYRADHSWANDRRAQHPGKVSGREGVMNVEASQEIARPVSEVFRFFAREHVLNHPRWDPDIALEATSDAPLAVGSVIRRRNSRAGTPVEGTMEVVEFEPERAFATVIREGPVEVRGGAIFEPIAADRTRLTITTDMPDDPRWSPSLITSRMQRSVATIKDLIEAERG